MQIHQNWIGTYQHLILEINIRLHKPADAKLETRRQRRILFKIPISQTFWCQTLKIKKRMFQKLNLQTSPTHKWKKQLKPLVSENIQSVVKTKLREIFFS